ncbi:MAG TPA: amidohydrolase family protein [Puia sp.]|jgi:cytosine/adenosine deaminase-related metal-dependent hydrolase|nr:amidohydrolase family protein [Puia sp.]
MLLCNVSIVGDQGLKNIRVADGKIQSILLAEKIDGRGENKAVLEFEGALAFPGLINSHDHLDFNLFPSIRNKVYNNYTEWGRDIHEKNKIAINKVLNVRQHLRVQWGIYKNLLNGFTTVVNHGTQLKTDHELINIFQNTYSLHSIGFETKWKWKINNPLKNKWPFSIHIGEGKDEVSHKEIDELIKWNFFKKNVIGIHGVAMDETQAAHFHAVVWCPASNYFLLDKTASVNLIKEQTKIIFGSDSTLTSSWNIWEHIRLARNEKMLTDAELFNTLTTEAATVWRLRDIGNISESQQADIVITKLKKGLNSLDNFFSIEPEDILMIMQKGNIRLFDGELKSQMIKLNFSSANFSKIKINGILKYVAGDLPGLMNEIRKYYPEADFPFAISD